MGNELGQCTNCGRPQIKIHRHVGDRCYCSACYVREFIGIGCICCKRVYRVPRGVLASTCPYCERNQRTCIRCGKPVPRASLTLGDKVACASCARYLVPPQPCPSCGRLSHHLARDLKHGVNTKICNHCRRKGNICCAICGRHREAAGTDSKGKLICKFCLEHLGQEFICPICSKAGTRYSAKKCSNCYWEENVYKKLNYYQASIHQQSVQKAMAAFIEHAIDHLGSKLTARRINHFSGLFFHLDSIQDAPHGINEQMLASCLSLSDLKSWEFPLDFLRMSDWLPSLDHMLLREEMELTACEIKVKGVSQEWFGPLLTRYKTYLLRLRARYRSRGWQRIIAATIFSALGSAQQFLLLLSREMVSSPQGITQEHLDAFLHMSPGYRNSLHRFIRYLNGHEHLFRALRIEKSPLHSISANLSHSGYLALIRRWSQASESLTIEDRTALLLMGIYAQSPTKIVKLQWKNLVEENGNFLLITDKARIPLVPIIANLICQIRFEQMASKKDLKSDYIFSSSTSGIPLHRAQLYHRLQTEGVKFRDLSSACLQHLIISGVYIPKILASSLGITTATASKYVDAIQPSMIEQTKKIQNS